MPMDFSRAISAHPIIAAVRDLNHLADAIESPVRVVFLMTGEILSVGDAIRELQKAGKCVVVHVDLIRGLSSDKEAVRFLARTAAPDAVVSTKLQLLQATRKEGIAAVQQLFMIDTQAFHTSVRHVSEFRPDAIEIMPGLMPRVIADLASEVGIPVIAAGLIKSYSEVQSAIDAGAVAAVVGDRTLWPLALE